MIALSPPRLLIEPRVYTRAAILCAATGGAHRRDAPESWLVRDPDDPARLVRIETKPEEART